MDFGLSDEQRLLEDTFRGYLVDKLPATRVRELVKQEDPSDPELWKGLAELGASGILLPESAGGSALGLLDAALVAQALGHAVAPTPFLSTAVIAPVALLTLGGSEAEGWLSGIATGDLRFGVALTESFSKREGAAVRAEGAKLVGKAMSALDVAGADLVLVAVEGGSLAVVRTDAAGLKQTTLTTTDRTRHFSELLFDGVRPEHVYADATAVTECALDAGRVALAADTIGAAEAMIEQAVEYSKQRTQFERVIASFQAVKHICAEMIADFEPTRSFLWYAAHSYQAAPDEFPLMAAHILAHSAEIGREIADMSTQVHGGVGYTDEQNLHFWFKRIAVARHLLGSPEALRSRAATLQDLAKAS